MPASPPELTPRSGEAVFDALRSRFVLFGGFTSQNTRETWEFGDGVWSLASTVGPSARRGNGLVYDSRRGRVLLFGGFDTAVRNDLWAWDGAAWTPLVPSGAPPAPRDAMGAAYDPARDRVVIFGGTAPGRFFRDTLEYDPEANRWATVATTGPSARGYIHAAFDPIRGRTVVFGGGGDQANQQVRDTWEWDGESWQLMATTGPSARRGYTMAYDGARGTVVLFGGYTDGAPAIFHHDTWEWDGARWTEVPAAGPAARSVAFAAYDPGNARLLMFGGGDQSGSLGDFWRFTGPPRFASQSGDLFKCPAGTAVFRVAPAGTGTFDVAWQIEDAEGGWNAASDGETPGLGTVLGSRTGTMTISAMDPSSSGRRFRCVATAIQGACGTAASDPVVLTICRTDVNCDDFLDFFDYDAFVDAFQSGGAGADFNGDGFVDFFDYDDFVAAFEVGC